MNTLFNRLSFFSLVTVVLIGFSSCNSNDLASATILVLQKQPISTGLQPIPIEGAAVKLYVDVPSNFEDVHLVTDNSGHVSFEHEFPVVLLIDVEFENHTVTKGMIMESGETTNVRVILPE